MGKPDQIQLNLPNSIIIGSVMITIGLIVHGYLLSPNQGKNLNVVFQGKSISATDYVEGNEKSNIVVIEYSDPECPFCIMFHNTIKKIRTDYKDRITFVYRHFPLTEIHPEAFDEARAMSCAGNIGGKDAYYNYIDSYFDYRIDSWKKSGEKQPPALPETGKEDLAKKIKIDMSAFNNCMKNKSTASIINDAIIDSQKALGDRAGTPTTFILKKKGKGYETIEKIEGAQSYEVIKKAIDEALK